VELLDDVLHIHEIVVDASHFYESTLVLGDEITEDRGKHVGQKLGEDLGQPVGQTNRTVIRNRHRIRLLGNKDDVGSVYQVHMGPTSERHQSDFIINILLYGLLTCLEQSPNKSIRARCLDGRQRKDNTFNLFFIEICLKNGEVMGLVPSLAQLMPSVLGETGPRWPWKCMLAPR
jgi:hypothetical protein